MRSFSDDLKNINVFVNGYQETNGKHDVNGTGISYDVDSLATVYKYHEKELDLDYKLTHLFF